MELTTPHHNNLTCYEMFQSTSHLDNITTEFKKQGVKKWIGFIWLRISVVAGCCESGNEPLGS
jgi:hypothetical protein